MESRKATIKNTLINSYVKNVDYIEIIDNLNKIGRPKETILISSECFKNICLNSKTKKSIEIKKSLKINIDNLQNYLK